MTSSEIPQNASRQRASGAGRPGGFALILILSFALSALVILGWAWRPNLKALSAQGGGELFPGFTAETGGGGIHGLVVTSLRSGSEAARAGMAVGDAIVAIDGHVVETLEQARRYLHSDARPALLLDLVHEMQRRRVKLMRSAGGDNGAQAAGSGG